MKKMVVFVLVFMCFLTQKCFAKDGSSYKVGKGDTLEISVWGYPELTRTITVRPDGKISLPLIEGEIIAENMTPEELDLKITKELSKEINEPKVTVIVSTFGSKKILIIGEVARPGSYPFTGSATILDAITQAGGYRDSACLDSVLVIRNRNTEDTEAFIVNMAKVIVKQDTYLDMDLQPDDVIYFPRSFISKVDNFLDFFKSNINYGLYYNLNE